MIPRHALPQIPKEKYKEFIDFLKNRGIQVTITWVDNKKLKPIQAHVNRGKVDHFKNTSSARKIPVIASQGGRILDGHHRWIANTELDPNGKTACILVKCDIKKLVELGHEFDGSFTRTVYECTIYGQRLFEDCYDDEEEISLMVRKPLRPKG